MKKKDFFSALIIGAAVGLLLQPVISNFVGDIQKRFDVPLYEVRFAVFVIFLIGAPAALFVASLLSRFVKVIYQFAKFAAVGVLNTSVDIGIFNLETFLLGALPTTSLFVLFKTVSFLAGTSNSFFWNKYWTFEASAKPAAGEVAKFYTVAIVGGLLNIGVATAVKIIGEGSVVSSKLLINLVAPIAGVLAAFLWDFLGYKYLVFKKD